MSCKFLIKSGYLLHGFEWFDYQSMTQCCFVEHILTLRFVWVDLDQISDPKLFGSW